MQPTKEKIHVSVIIPTYNRSQLLNYTLYSLTLQNLSKDNFEVIVVDDGSDDDTKWIVYEYRDTIDINYYYQENKGYRPGSARNLGILNAKGSICLFVDTGVILSPQCIREHLDFHNQERSNIAAVGYVYGYGLYRENYSENQLRESINPFHPADSINRLKENNILDVREKYYSKYNDKIYDLPAPWILFLTCNVSVGRNNLLNVGMFDEKYDGRWGCEDNDLGFRLNISGVKIKICRGAESIHYPHESDTIDKLEQGYLNCIYFNSKYQTEETKLFLNHYKEKGTPKSPDINEMLLNAKIH
jgi:glycosyltransferase involved in cell wall biosynthesis